MRASSVRFSRFFIFAVALSPLSVFAQQAVDPTYHGSSFNEVVSVIRDEAITAKTSRQQKEFDAYSSGHIPNYKVNFGSMGGALMNPLFGRSKTTLVDRADYYDHFSKFVHANGVCVMGQWKIEKATPYSGFFKQGANGLFIGRVSVALQETTRAGRRGFGFAGKIYPTMDPNAVAETTSFFTVDILSGENSNRFLDQAVTNEPPLTASFGLAAKLLKIIPAFISADSSPMFRPVTQIARMNADGAIAAPVWMRLRAAPGTIKNEQTDFRNEVLQAVHDNRTLTFIIDVSSTTKDRNATTGWEPVGTIKVDQAEASYGCDRRLHFTHPKDDKSNKPAKKKLG